MSGVESQATPTAVAIRRQLERRVQVGERPGAALEVPTASWAPTSMQSHFTETASTANIIFAT